MNIIIGRSRRKLLRRYWKIEGMKLSDLCPLAEQIILDDPYLSEQTMIDSGPASFGGKLREDAFFVRNKFERQFNTMFEIVWMLLYRSISIVTNTGPYVVQIPNFEIRKIDGIRTVHNLGWCELTRNGEVTKRGAILILWLAEIGELCSDGHRYLHYFLDDHPVLFDQRWQDDESFTKMDKSNSSEGFIINFKVGLLWNSGIIVGKAKKLVGIEK